MGPLMVKYMLINNIFTSIQKAKHYSPTTITASAGHNKVRGHRV